MHKYRNRYARVLDYGKGRDFSETVAKEIWERDEGICAYCGKPGMVLDHVLPYAKGGPSIRANGVVSCRPCNSTKAASLGIDYLTRAFLHLLGKGESLSWLDEFWDGMLALQKSVST